MHRNKETPIDKDNYRERRVDMKSRYFFHGLFLNMKMIMKLRRRGTNIPEHATSGNFSTKLATLTKHTRPWVPTFASSLIT